MLEYAEYFIEESDYRWRICELDAGLITIEYQDFENGVWKKVGDGLTLSSEYVDALCNALKRIKNDINSYEKEK